VKSHLLWSMLQVPGATRNDARRLIGEALLRYGTATAAAKSLSVTPKGLRKWLTEDVRRDDDPAADTDGVAPPLAELWAAVCNTAHRTRGGRPPAGPVLERPRAEVAAELGITRQALDRRLKSKSLEEALTTPRRRQRS
jgi:hypothetical protein